MRLPEHFQQFFVADFARVIDDAHHFAVPGAPTAHFFVRGIRRAACSVAGRGAVDAGRFPEAPFCAPEASEAEHREAHAFRERGRQAGAVYGVRLRNTDWRAAPRKHVRSLWRYGVLAEGRHGSLESW